MVLTVKYSHLKFQVVCVPRLEKEWGAQNIIEINMKVLFYILPGQIFKIIQWNIKLLFMTLFIYIHEYNVSLVAVNMTYDKRL